MNEHQKKRHARIKLQTALRQGRVVKPAMCAVCGGANMELHGHHPDYALPFKVIWLCPACHGAVHSAPQALFHLIAVGPYDACATLVTPNPRTALRWALLMRRAGWMYIDIDQKLGTRRKTIEQERESHRVRQRAYTKRRRKTRRYEGWAILSRQEARPVAGTEADVMREMGDERDPEDVP